jgi:hypothetical protein
MSKEVSSGLMSKIDVLLVAGGPLSHQKPKGNRYQKGSEKPKQFFPSTEEQFQASVLVGLSKASRARNVPKCSKPAKNAFTEANMHANHTYLEHGAKTCGSASFVWFQHHRIFQRHNRSYDHSEYECGDAIQ